MCMKDNSYSRLTQLAKQNVLLWTATANSFNLTWLTNPMQRKKKLIQLGQSPNPKNLSLRLSVTTWAPLFLTHPSLSSSARPAPSVSHLIFPTTLRRQPTSTHVVSSLCSPFPRTQPYSILRIITIHCQANLFVTENYQGKFRYCWQNWVKLMWNYNLIKSKAVKWLKQWIK
jgi:hypothetical protein